PLPASGRASKVLPPCRGAALSRRQYGWPILDLARGRAAGAEADARGRPLGGAGSGFLRGGLDAGQGAGRDGRGSRIARSVAAARPTALPAVPRGAGARISRHSTRELLQLLAGACRGVA